MMIYIAGAIILFAAFMIFWSWLNENNVATSKIVPVRTAENTSFLQNVLNREMGSVGEPLVMYAPVKAKQLENDLYRSDLPIYTVSCEERGRGAGALHHAALSLYVQGFAEGCGRLRPAARLPL